MVSVSNLSRSADKFERRASSAGQDYTDGVEEVSDSEWQEATLNQSDNWSQAVQEAAANGLFARGVQNTQKSWQDQSINVGANRFTQGAGQAGDTWRQGFERYASRLESTSLDPRGPRGSQVNQNRSIAVQEALHNERQQG